MSWDVRCPFCWRLVLPSDEASLYYVLAPRLAFHLYDEHPYEATTLRLRLENPPTEWPVIEAAVA